jgi:N-formylmaleamate deformylase
MKRLLTILIGIAVLAIITQLPLLAAPSFKVDVKGNGKISMILIPGLTCPGEVWDETLAHYANDFRCHVVSLPGFAGTPIVQREHYLASMRDEIIDYIKTNKLKKPVLLGHSLGGFLSLWIAVQEPDLIGRVIAVDALPYFPAIINPAATVESMKPMAEAQRKMMASATREQVKQSQQYFLPTMATAPDKLLRIGQWGLDSDAGTTAQAMYEMQTIDLRSELSKIKVPILVLGAWIAYKNFGTTRESTLTNFNEQYKHVATKDIRITDTARHFIMYDDAAWFFEQTDSFLKK